MLQTTTTALTSPIKSVYLQNATALPTDATPAEILEAGNMDFNVALEPVYTREGVEIPGKRAIRNQTSGEIYGIAGPTWAPTQHATLANTAVKMRDEYGLELVGAGSTRNGQNGFVVMRTNDAIDAGNDDIIRGYITLQNPHKYGYAVTVNGIGERFHCANQIVFGRGSIARYHHSENHGYTVDRALRALKLLQTGLTELQDVSQALRGYRLSHAEVVNMISKLFNMSLPDQDDKDYTSKINRYYNKLDKLMRLKQDMPGSAEAGQNTAWQLLNLVTYHADHIQNSDNPEKRLESATHGVAGKRKRNAIKLLCDHVGIDAPATLIAA